ncbi:MAG: 5'/3'-nucleotidase SurE [Saprospiraceae bacterium]|nr:5'/3'-nucleotidase SurE [Saprospiraceae bacterium]
MKKKPLILVTNDDGTFAPGIAALVEVAQKHGDVVVVAPDSPQSAKGHAITISDPIRLKAIDHFGDIEAYACSGTPVDCVKLAKNVVFKDRNIDLCVSGINHGSNASINIIYSGTLSAAMEASIEGIPSIGFSLLDYSFEADMSGSKVYADKVIGEMLKNGMGKGNLLNVNIPKLPADQIKGIRVCRQGEGYWNENFKEALDPRGQKYYWLTGEFGGEFENPETDLYALDNGYVSVVPSSHDLTNYHALKALKSLEDA